VSGAEPGELASGVLGGFKVMISARPAEAGDRAIPRHWEGDLIIGLGGSAIGTLVERTTRYTMLLHLPPMDGYGRQPRVHNGPALAGHGAEAVRDAIATTITTLPAQLRRSLTWYQGTEMAQHAQLCIDTGIAIYFCDPHSPWQRDTNENTYWCRMSGAGILRRAMLRPGRRVTRRTRAEKLSVDLSTAAYRARALTGSDLIEAC
jgi:hypothetical protein